MKKIYFLWIIALSHVRADGQPEKKIDSFMRYCQTQLGYNGVVLIADRNKVIYERAFGKANRETNIDNSLDTKFRLGSISKQFTAFLILQQVEEKRLSLNDRVADFLPAFDQDGKRDVRIFHLLTHTSGLADYTNLKQFNEQVVNSKDSIIHLIASAPLSFNPSSAYSYSNSNFYLLAEIVEKITGRRFSEALNEMITKKAAMTNSGEEEEQSVQNEAKGYITQNGKTIPAPFIDMQNTKGGGGMYGTAGDLLNWSLFFQSKLTSDTVLKNALQPFRLSDETTTIYACGWCLMPDVIFHTGHINGFANLIAIDTIHQYTIVLLTNNSYHQLYVTMQSLRSILNNQVPRIGPKSIRGMGNLSDYSGQYSDGKITVTIKDTLDCIQGTAFGQSQLLRPYTKDEFYFLDSEAIVKFERDPRGQVIALHSFQDYYWTTLKKQ